MCIKDILSHKETKWMWRAYSSSVVNLLGTGEREKEERQKDEINQQQ